MIWHPMMPGALDKGYSPSCLEEDSPKLVGILCCVEEATPLSEYQLMLRLPQAKLVAHQHQGLLYR